MIAGFGGGGLRRKFAGFLSLAASSAKMSFLLCTIFLKSVLINRSPQLFVLRIGAVSFHLTSGGAKPGCSTQAGAQNQWDV
jgi:hypothetical protein